MRAVRPPSCPCVTMAYVAEGGVVATTDNVSRPALGHGLLGARPVVTQTGS